MTFQSWKHKSEYPILIMDVKLQWSHDFSVMETMTEETKRKFGTVASMEP